VSVSIVTMEYDVKKDVFNARGKGGIELVKPGE